MKFLVFLVGLMLVAVSSAYFMFPALVEDLQKWIDDKGHLRWIIGLRFLWGLVLMFGAHTTAYPTAIWWLGLVAVLAAVALVFFPPATIRKILAWALNRPAHIVRAWVLVAIRLL